MGMSDFVRKQWESSYQVDFICVRLRTCELYFIPFLFFPQYEKNKSPNQTTAERNSNIDIDNGFILNTVCVHQIQ